MMSSTASTGKNHLGDHPPYVLAITSHKGGTGRTTLAAGIAWLWGQRGLKIALVDADPVRAATLLALNAEGVCPWPNVHVVVAQQGVAKIPPGMDAVIIDSPPATEPLAQRVFAKADGVVICSLADSLALNTLPAATRAVREARETNPDLDLLGIAVNIFNSSDLSQSRCLSALRGARGGLFVEPPIPARPELREWPLHPGSELPDGPGRVALRALADTFRDQIVESGWEQFANRRETSHAYLASR
jgi:cellulose biosynthesis protein BcsQ